MIKKILFSTLEPFSIEKHITDEVKRTLPIEQVLSIEEVPAGGIAIDTFDFDSIDYLLSTIGIEVLNCKDEERKNFFGADRLVNEIELISHEELREEYDLEEAEEEWKYMIVEDQDSIPCYTYLVKAEIGE